MPRADLMDEDAGRRSYWPAEPAVRYLPLLDRLALASYF